MKLCILIGLAALAPTTVSAWGVEGHETVCEIAYRELSQRAQDVVDELLSQEDPQFRTLRQACVWPDRDGKIQKQRRPDHFINIPRYWGSIWNESCHDVATCTFAAIWKDLSIVGRKSAQPKDRLIALKFLGHWLGDIHQPLHVSYEDDRGGNEILVATNLGCSQKLHAIWDTCLPRHLMRKHGVDTTARLGALLQQSVTPADRAAWTEDLTPLTWANESLRIARSNGVEYCLLDGQMCWYAEDQREFFEAEEVENGGRRLLDLSEAYEQRWDSVAEERIKRAGVRLGALLNDVLTE